MNRRHFLKTAGLLSLTVGLTPHMVAGLLYPENIPISLTNDDYLKDYLYKIRHFDKPHPDDVYLDCEEFETLKLARNRLKRLQRTVGHGNFYLLSFDDALKIACNYKRVGRFTSSELIFLEKLFYVDGARYGFMGDKPIKNLTDSVKKGEVVKIPYTGNYLYRDAPMALYNSIKKDIGDQVVLTSGVRSVIKQFMLFLNKAYSSNGNLSMASRSLAPPGYSYHGIGDFDVGQVGYGVHNFTERFTETSVFKQLTELGYIDLRYQVDNLLGVRFEPWHVKAHQQI